MSRPDPVDTATDPVFNAREFFEAIPAGLQHLKGVNWEHIDRKDVDYFKLGVTKIITAAETAGNSRNTGGGRQLAVGVASRRRRGVCCGAELWCKSISSHSRRRCSHVLAAPAYMQPMHTPHSTLQCRQRRQGTPQGRATLRAAPNPRLRWPPRLAGGG